MAKEKLDKDKVGSLIQLQGRLTWARLHPAQRNFTGYEGKSLDDQEGEYSITVVLVNQDGSVNEKLVKQCKEVYLNVKEKDGLPYIEAKRPHSMLVKSGEQEGQRITKGPPPTFYSATPGDGCLTPLPESILVGNNSYGYVNIFAKIYTPESMKKKKATARLLGVQVTSLDEYKSKIHTGKAGFSSIEGETAQKPTSEGSTSSNPLDDELPF